MQSRRIFQLNGIMSIWIRMPNPNYFFLFLQLIYKCIKNHGKYYCNSWEAKCGEVNTF